MKGNIYIKKNRFRVTHRKITNVCLGKRLWSLTRSNEYLLIVYNDG